MFAADARVFLADMGSAVTWISSTADPKPSGLMLFDTPDERAEGGEIISRQFEVCYETAAFPGLKRGELLTVYGDGGGRTFKLRTDPLREGDGVFSTAHLTLVPS